jgi:hypothetical protein
MVNAAKVNGQLKSSQHWEGIADVALLTWLGLTWHYGRPPHAWKVGGCKARESDVPIFEWRVGACVVSD